MPFIAPELFEQPPRYSPTSDLYALGITLACLLLSTNPYPSGSFELLRDWVLRGSRPQVATARPDLPSSLAKLADRMMELRPTDRPGSAAEALATLAAIGQPEAARNLGVGSPAELSTVSLASQLDSQDAIPTAKRSGAWERGEMVYSSSNWAGHVVTHTHTGKAARLMQLQPHSPLAMQSPFILSAAARASMRGVRGNNSLSFPFARAVSRGWRTPLM